MIRTIAMLGFWALAAPVAALIGFPWTFISGDVSLLYRMFMIGCRSGVRLTGVRVETVGLEKLDPAALISSCRTTCRTWTRRLLPR